MSESYTKTLTDLNKSEKKKKKKAHTYLQLQKQTYIIKKSIHTHLILSNLYLTHAGSHILICPYTPNVVYSHNNTQKTLHRNSFI